MDFKQFAKKMIVILEQQKANKAYKSAIFTLKPIELYYRCVLCENVCHSAVNPIYSLGWTWVKNEDYLCQHCSYHVSLLVSLQQQV